MPTPSLLPTTLPVSLPSPEPLVPAGGMDSVRAAVLCGADAVSMGAKSFNARRNAENFDLDQFRQAVDYCHLYGVKVYLTLNTLVYDEELSALLEEIHRACQAAVDGVIVQDLGVVRAIQKIAPELPLTPPPRWRCTTWRAPAWRRKWGCAGWYWPGRCPGRRFARWWSRWTFRPKSLSTEPTASVSGQCYLSSMLGERSGNRGLCAQPCRLPFGPGEGAVWPLPQGPVSGRAYRGAERVGRHLSQNRGPDEAP